MREPRLSRRTFLHALGSTVAVSALPAFAASGPGAGHALALAAMSHGIHTMRCFGGSWRSVHFTPSLSPSAMVLSRDARLLHVANEVSRCDVLPTGSVTTYRVSGTGALSSVNVAPLALSAMRPYAMAPDPAGDWLAVASEGGVLSVLEIDVHGLPGAVVAAHKQLTREPVSLRFGANGLLHIKHGESEQSFRVSRASGLTPIAAQARMAGALVQPLLEGMPEARSVVALPVRQS